MRYFLDTEFIEDGKTIELISIGIVAEDGREYYAIDYNYPKHKASEWVQQNVLVHLPPDPLPQIHATPNHWKRSEAYRQGWRTKDAIREEVLAFCSHPKDNSIEFWADYASYDWVALCQIFGTMMNLPSHFPMYCNDIQQWRRDLGNPDLPAQKGIVHHALHDAKYCKELWEFLSTYSEDCVVERDA